MFKLTILTYYIFRCVVCIFVKNNVKLLHCTFYKTDQFDLTDFTPTEL